ncbi:unnamed protein product [Rhizoctonia solani]|uniref:Uncharacterized protein n=1 Tax=Rhizoctonia solani TaxID=456999 RepID=A0A8H3DZX6_9AGAM|nr:unnamed protein product [Rhizoctonia solani]
MSDTDSSQPQIIVEGDSDTDSWVGERVEADDPGPFLSLPQLDPELIKSYYTAYIGLSNGSGSRRSLPPELVLLICRLAGFEVWRAKKSPRGRRKIYSSSNIVWSHVWFQTEPFTKEMLGGSRSVQLVTMSRHQGWVGDRDAGSWSWFELQVARPTAEGNDHAEAKLNPDGDKISWRCLEHPVDEETAQAQKDFAEHKGSVFGPDHELWTQIEEGDVLQVVMKTQFGGWSNTASDGVLRISTWWEPSVEMMDLMGKNTSNTQSE